MGEEMRLGSERAWSALERLLLGLTFGCFGLMALAVSVLSARQLAVGMGSWPMKLLCVLVPAAALTGLAALCRRAEESGAGRFALLLFLGAFALKGAFAAVVDTQPVSDFVALYLGAVELAQNGTPLSVQPYFQMWPYQSGQALYLAALVKLFGEDLLWIKLFNALWAAFTSVMVYALARRISSEGGARTAAVLYTFYPGTWLLLPVLTNQHLSELLFMLAFWLYTTPAQAGKKRLGLAAAAGAVLALGNAIRPAAIVALAAAGCLMVLELLRERRSGGRRLAAAIVRFALFAVVYVGVMGALGGLTRLSGVNEYGLSSSCPEWKFACGLNEETSGCYSAADAKLIFYESENPRQAARELALERIQMPPARLLRLLGNKIRIMWGGYEETTWMLTPNVVEQIDASALPVCTEQLSWWTKMLSCGVYSLSFLLMALGGAVGLKKEREAAQLLALVSLAYFGVHLFIEIQPRYRSLMYAVAFPLTALGFDGLWALWERRKKSRTVRKT